ncbi:16S rRNA (cytosine(1402)-N(4))-methyltransferase RsmH [Candidatus Microgenomates bacterium]|nr:16S rRNA (cytosine(1402)-N(4))-methyltransferase RsmH [Candidatus Microgenomates bacterium]
MTMAHIPVLLAESIEALNIVPDGTYVDATLGFGGHSVAILKKLNQGKLIGIEIDKNTYDQAKSLFSDRENVFLHCSNFVNAFGSFVPHSFGQVDGILFDLGVNVHQIKESDKGLSFLKNQYLDMRLSESNGPTAADIISSSGEQELVEIFKKADERFARPIAKKIIEQRRRAKIETTDQLAELVGSIKKRRGRTHPATQVFMALRMTVNKELENISKALPDAVEILKPGGRIAVITFHSTEDRLVKNIFKELVAVKKIKLINKKVITASRKEQLSNPLSRSAKLRIGERL